MTQREAILKYLDQFGSITPMQAFEDLGITKLATRVSEMKRDGIILKKTPYTKKNRYGHAVTYMEYSRGE